MKLYRKKDNGRYEEVTRSEIVLEAVKILNRTPGGKEVTDLLTLKTLQGKLTIETVDWQKKEETDGEG